MHVDLISIISTLWESLRLITTKEHVYGQQRLDIEEKKMSLLILTSFLQL